MELSRMSPETAATYAHWFRALADPARMRILSLIAHHDAPLTVGEIVAAGTIAQSTVSHHLAILREAGFVRVDNVATRRFYRVNRACVAKLPEAAASIMGAPTGWHPQADYC